jgi:phosphoribosylanthranilate isomerase
MLTKICGIARTADALAAAGLGADFIGLVFFERSRRFVTLPAAREISLAVKSSGYPARVAGVFVNARRDEIERAADEACLDMIQIHGEPAGRVGVTTIRAVSPREASAGSVDCDYLLVDNSTPLEPGGTGRLFDWSELRRESIQHPFFVAGGLQPGNVAEAIATLRPDGVDVSSGVESSPGIKCETKLRAFFDAVRSAAEVL